MGSCAQRKVSDTRHLGIDESYIDDLGGLMTALTGAMAVWGKKPSVPSQTPIHVERATARQAKKGWRHSVVLDLSHSSHGAGGRGRLEVAQCLCSERRAASESLLVKWENGRKRTAWANVE